MTHIRETTHVITVCAAGNGGMTVGHVSKNATMVRESFYKTYQQETTERIRRAQTGPQKRGQQYHCFSWPLINLLQTIFYISVW